MADARALPAQRELLETLGTAAGRCLMAAPKFGVALSGPAFELDFGFVRAAKEEAEEEEAEEDWEEDWEEEPVRLARRDGTYGLRQSGRVSPVSETREEAERWEKGKGKTQEEAISAANLARAKESGTTRFTTVSCHASGSASGAPALCGPAVMTVQFLPDAHAFEAFVGGESLRAAAYEPRPSMRDLETIDGDSMAETGLPNASAASWSREQVTEWFAATFVCVSSSAAYVAAIESAELDGEILLSLTAETLSELVGATITKSSHRSVMITEIQKLQRAVSAASSSRGVLIKPGESLELELRASAATSGLLQSWLVLSFESSRSGTPLSDTSTAFSICRKLSAVCLPPADMDAVLNVEAKPFHPPSFKASFLGKAARVAQERAGRFRVLRLEEEQLEQLPQRPAESEQIGIRVQTGRLDEVGRAVFELRSSAELSVAEVQTIVGVGCTSAEYQACCRYAPTMQSVHIRKLQALLHVEEAQMERDITAYDCLDSDGCAQAADKETGEESIPWKMLDRVGDLVSFKVPGAAEQRPALLLGDRVRIRLVDRYDKDCEWPVLKKFYYDATGYDTHRRPSAFPKLEAMREALFLILERCELEGAFASVDLRTSIVQVHVPRLKADVLVQQLMGHFHGRTGHNIFPAWVSPSFRVGTTPQQWYGEFDRGVKQLVALLCSLPLRATWPVGARIHARFVLNRLPIQHAKEALQAVENEDSLSRRVLFPPLQHWNDVAARADELATKAKGDVWREHTRAESDIWQEEHLAKAKADKAEASQEAPKEEVFWVHGEGSGQEINLEQKEAVRRVIGVDSPSPTVIFGPPGTGKSLTLIEAISQCLLLDPLKNVHRGAAGRRPQILACAPSNAAVDVLAERLVKIGLEKAHPVSALLRTQPDAERSAAAAEEAGGEAGYMLRVNAPHRLFESVGVALLPFSPVAEGNSTLFVIPSHDVLAGATVVCATFQCAGLIAASGYADFDMIFMDECSQATIPASLVPLLAGRAETKVVLAGDPFQLGPSIRSPMATRLGLGTSLMQRLVELAKQLQLSDEDDAVDRRGGFGPASVMKLRRNYRSHSSIIELSSQIFYENELLACADPNLTDSAVKWEELQSESFPVMFYGVLGKESRELDSPSRWNAQEAAKVVELIEKLLGSDKVRVQAREIGVIAMYRAQVLKIRMLLRSHDLYNVKVGSVDDYQGQESKVIFISTVVASDRKFDGSVDPLGPGSAAKFNVAITRAQALNVIVGNPHCLGSDVNWRKLISYAADNASYQGVPCFAWDPAEGHHAPGELEIDAELSMLERLASMSLLGGGNLDQEFPTDETLSEFYREEQPWRVDL